MHELIAISLFLVGCVSGACVMRLFIAKTGAPHEKLAALAVENQVLSARMGELTNQNMRAAARLEAMHAELRDAREQAVRHEAEGRGLRERFAQHQTEQEKNEHRLRESFENLTAKIFDAQAEKFNASSKEKLETMLGPLQKQLQDFENKVNEHAKDQFSLRKEIATIVLANQKMSQDTVNLTNALKGNSKTQGDWGELVLENILEASGLRRGEDYIVQGIALDLKNEEGRAQKPDVVVKLPEKKHIIIDAKVSLTHYEGYCTAEDEATRQSCLRDYLASVRAHVNGLEARGYQHNEKLGAPDFVLMFMPTEGAYALAIQQDKDVHSFAWNKKIVIVCPSTLFATLRTVAGIWRLDMQNQNAVEIARQGGALYDKIHGFVEDMQRIGKTIEAANGAYASAMEKLSTGQGNILRRTENLKKLGLKVKRDLPPALIAGDDSGEGVVIDIADKIQAN